MEHYSDLDRQAAYLQEWLERTQAMGESLLLSSMAIECEVRRNYDDSSQFWAWKTQVKRGELSRQVADYLRQALQLITDSAFVLLNDNPAELPVRAIIKQSQQMLSQSLAEEEAENGLRKLSSNSPENPHQHELYRVTDG